MEAVVWGRDQWRSFAARPVPEHQLSPESTGPARHGKASPNTRDAKGGTALKRGACGPLWAGGVDPKALRSRLMRGPVTGGVLALGLRRCEAARVTSERKRGSDAGGDPRYHAALVPNFRMTCE